MTRWAYEIVAKRRYVRMVHPSNKRKNKRIEFAAIAWLGWRYFLNMAHAKKGNDLGDYYAALAVAHDELTEKGLI